ncbi:putative ADP-ribosylation factor, arf [Mycena polygramma]|nr:putative ADP-ribosylation factor, arf [Mycena polygramma]
MGSAISTGIADRLAGSALPKSFDLVMIGLDDAGKTSVVNRLKRRELPGGVLPATVTTIGSTIETIAHGRHSVTIWEFGGSEKIRPLWRRYFWNGHGYIFLVDAAKPTRFAEAKEELQRIWKETEHVGPLLVLANKMDLPDAVKLSAFTEALGIHELAKSDRKLAVKGVSAMTGAGLDDALDWFVENISHQHIAATNEGKKNMAQAW